MGKWVWPGDETSTGDTKGWDRVSIAFHSRRPYRPTVAQTDLLVPTAASRLHALGMCLGCAVCMTLLYAWVPLMMLTVFVHLRAAWFGGILGAVALGATVVLFLVSTAEDRRHRRLAQEL